MMTLDVLICTYNEGIEKVPSLLLEPQPNVHYIVSFQVSNPSYRDVIPSLLIQRDDVMLYISEGVGLAKNRNEALRCATSDLCLIADDDVSYSTTTFSTILATFEQHEKVGVALFEAMTDKGAPLKSYPPFEFDYAARPRGYYPSSVEIAFRREIIQNNLLFDERFGLGNKLLGSGEDEVFVHQAAQRGISVRFFPKVIVTTQGSTTGTRIYEEASIQRAKGAVLWLIYGKSAVLRCFKFTLLSYLQKKSPFGSLWRELMRGVKEVQNSEGRNG